MLSHETSARVAHVHALVKVKYKDIVDDQDAASRKLIALAARAARRRTGLADAFALLGGLRAAAGRVPCHLAGRLRAQPTIHEAAGRTPE